jgi:hypothetical protein
LKRIKGLQAKTSALKGGATQDPMALPNAQAACEAYRKMWRLRKQKCMDIVSAIADGAEKPLNDIIVRKCKMVFIYLSFLTSMYSILFTQNVIGMETDEEFGMVLPTLSV